MNSTASFCLCVVCCALCCLASSCDRHAATSVRPSHTTPTVASLAPAATDLILGMNAGDHLIAVSNYDVTLPGIPKVGDYQNTDWEKLAELGPSIMIVQMEESRLPQGLRDRAAAQGTKLVNIQIERLDDIFKTLHQLGDTLNEPAKAAVAESSMRARLARVHERVANDSLVPTLLSLDDNGSFAAGPNTYLDDLLSTAGGRNVLSGTSQHWPGIDKERLLQLAPAAVIELLPDATLQVVQRAAEFWKSVPTVPAVAGGNTFVHTNHWVMTPGIHVADLAEQMATDLHPVPSTQALP